MTDTVMSTDLPVNDPTNPAHRLADDLRNGRIPGYAADDVRAVLTMLAASPQGEGDCVCVQRGDGPEGCGLCNETGVATPPAEPQRITHDGGPNPAPARELWEKVAQIIEAAIERHNPGNSLRHTVDDADAILSLIQSERGGA